MQKLTGPTSQNYGCTGETTPRTKRSAGKDQHGQKIFGNLGLEKETIDKVLDEASKDIGKQKAAIDAKTEELKTANATIDRFQSGFTNENDPFQG